MKQSTYHLIVLICVAALLYGVFHYSQFVTSDEVRYAIGLKISQEHTENFFNYEMSFGFYQLLKPAVKFFSTDKLPLFLNVVSSFVAVLLLIPLYFLAQNLFSPRVGFFSGLFLIFIPSFWYLSRCGHPGVLALFFFLTSIFLFDQALLRRRGNYILLGVSILFAIGSLLMRADSLLWFLTPIGLVLCRKEKNKDALMMLCFFYLVSVLGYVAVRWLILGYLVQPGGGTVLVHILKRLISLSSMAKSILKNTGLFIFGVLPVVAVFLLLGLIHIFRARKWRLLGLVLLWGAPTLIFLPFRGMAFARLSVPILLPLLMATLSWIDRSLKSRYRYVVPLALLFLAHLSPLFTQSLLQGRIPSQVNYQGKPVLSVPVGSMFADFYHKKDYLEAIHDVAKKVTQEKMNDVMILTDSVHESWYRYELLITRKAECSWQKHTGIRSDFGVYLTPENHFTVFVIQDQLSWEEFVPLIENELFADVLFHVTPFMLEHPEPQVFYERDEFLSYLKANPEY